MNGLGVIVSLGFVIAVAACSGSPAPAPSAQPAPAATPPRPAAEIAPPPATPVAVAPPTYERKGRRDPFQPIEIVQDAEIKLAVASARLTGIVRGSATLALLEMPDGLGYVMRPGDTLAEGRLIEIGTDNVVFSVPARKGSATGRLFLRLPSD